MRDGGELVDVTGIDCSSETAGQYSTSRWVCRRNEAAY
jgi:hypothetical protein